MRERPLLVYDGDCPFCVRTAARWRRALGARIDFAPLQEAGEPIAREHPPLELADFRRAVALVEPEPGRERVSFGAEAAARAWAHGRGGIARAPLLAYRRLPLARPLMDAGYRFVADHRPAMLRLDRWLRGDDPCASIRLAWRVMGALLLAALAALVIYRAA